ncbi:hypothetical protein L1049_000296 [Liquidambar formosana]|uniref:HMA domain-containing protein n=1 Tax=Liquidambar formosana TaxID=63359 RepID=A0AAP0R2K4_LIQFO
MAANGENMAVKKFQKSYFDVLGLCCSSEVPLIENILKPLDGVKDVSVIVPTRTVIVVHDDLLISQLQIVKALNQARLEANVRVKGEANYKKKWPSPSAIACGVLLLLSLLKYIYHPFQWVALGAVAVGIFPIAWKGLVAIQNFRLDINILAVVAVMGTIALKDYVEAGTIVFLFGTAEWLESRASHKATAVMSSLMSIAPQKAVIAETGEVVNVDEVKVNTILAVKAGYISVKTTALAEDCVVAKMAKLVEEAQNNKSRTQRFIDKCAKYYTPGHPLIWAAVLADVGTCLLVISNSMLLLRKTHKHGGKCSKSPTAQPNHKHGCSTGGCHSSDKNQNCHNIAQKMCEPQNCSSQMCASKCQSSPFNSSSCENKTCTNSADGPDACVGGDVCHEVKHHDHGQCDMVDHDLELQSTHYHLNHAQICSVSGQQLTDNDHCHMVHCAENHVKDHVEDLGNMVESSCEIQTENRAGCCDSKKLGTNLGTTLHAPIDNARSSSHVESTAKHACVSFEKRVFGGCCKSFIRRECRARHCRAKHGHFGDAFGGGLSEIRIG